MQKLIYVLAIFLLPSLTIAQNENYVKSTTYQEATTDGVNKESGGAITQDDKVESIMFYDGLGRTMESVGIRAGVGNKDIITHIGYDEFGRQDKEWLPYAETTNGGLYRGDGETETVSFYNSSKYESTLNPYIEKHLEASPLSRVLEQAAPGADWALNKTSDLDHTIKFGYQTNSNSDFVRKFSVEFDQDNPNNEPQLVEDTDRVFSANQLYKTVTKDENWLPGQQYPNDHTTEEYKDKQGRVILKRTFNSKQWLDTYYVYDDYGNLTFVIPPKVMTYESILQPYLEQESGELWDTSIYENTFWGEGSFDLEESNGTLKLYLFLSYYPNNAVLKNIVEQLDFDPPLPDMDLGELSFTNSSGTSVVFGTAYIENGNFHIDSNGVILDESDSVIHIDKVFQLTNYQASYKAEEITEEILDGLCYQYRYDARNRLIEKKIPGKGKEFIVYNKLDQPIMTQDANLGINDKWLVTKYDAFGRVAYTGITTNPQYREYFQDLVDNSSNTQFEEKVVSGTGYRNTYYTQNAIPIYLDKILTINYYDDYSFNKASLSLPPIVEGENIVNWNNTDKIKTRGLATGTKVRVLGTDDFITTLIGYDNKGRVIYTGKNNPYLEVLESNSSKLDFIGNLEKMTTIHTKTGHDAVTTVDEYDYDTMNRLVEQRQSVNGSVNEVIAHNTYDDLGQLEIKGVGGKETQSRLQNVNYTYNVRGWLKQINNPTTLGADLFSFKINYNTPQNGATALYTGNISETSWKTANVDNSLKWYKYEYDPLNRLIQAMDNENDYSLRGFSAQSPYVKYDRNGNIKSLLRLGYRASTETITTIDKLVYTYEEYGNKLLGVMDQSNVVDGFIDGNTSGNDYYYDANGNMDRDLNKGIGTSTTDGITYNHLNLPTDISINGNGHSGTISYIYDATGVKLKKQVSTGTTVEYAGNYIYENGNLQFIGQPEGYIEPKNTNDYSQGFTYIYQYKDHLGNNRLSYKDVSSTSTPNLEILEENNYYPFGLEHKGYNKDNVTSTNLALKYKYNGKELQDEFGLDWYDVKARNYDQGLGRWMNLDPLAEKFPSWSPYNFSMNNTIRYIDPDGRAPLDIIDIVKNDKGEWEITNVQITEGDDVFRVTNEGETTNYTFSEGEYGKRFNVLNLENNDNYTLGVYHISGQEGEGASGFAVTPGGSASTEVNSGKRLPDDTYSLSATGNGSDQSAFKWVQPLLNTGDEGGYVGGRGVKIHPAPSKLPQTKASQWTAGCYVVSKDYLLQNGNVYYNSEQSIKTSNQINTILGGTKHYNSIGKKSRPGSDFSNGIDFKLIQKTGF